MTAHSKLGASSMYRWSACPGSVAEIERVNLPAQSSAYAEEGTDAHALAAAVLKGYVRSAALVVGETVDLEGRKFEVTQEMVDAVDLYNDTIDADEDSSTKLHVEQRFDLSAIYPGCFGTADAVVWQPDTQTLIVSDLKYGAGIPVEVENNPQLMYYGLGALLSTKYPAKRVRLQIIQPRCEHPKGPVRRWEIDAIDLIDFAADLVQYASATKAKDAPLKAGPHCRFCPAAPACREIERHRNEVAKLEFGTVDPDPHRLALALESLPVLEAFIKRVRELAYSEAEAGRTPPGWKIVAKKGYRKWIDEDQAAGILVGHAEEIYEPRKLKSPAQIEKLLGKAAAKKVCADLIHTPSSGHALVPESDPRLPVRPDAAIEFSSVSLD